MSLWNFCAWVGIAALTTLTLWMLHGIVEGILVTRVGWLRLGELGFWRAIPAAFAPRWKLDQLTYDAIRRKYSD